MSLQAKAVSAELLTLLRRLMCAEPLNEFYLVGGTALALRYGHRISVDLDLFTHLPFDASKLAEFLTTECALTESVISENTVLGVMAGIKTDFIAHRYPLITGVQVVDGMRLLATEDFDDDPQNLAFRSTNPLVFANGALSWIVFKRDRHQFPDICPGLAIRKYRTAWPLLYWVSGGLKPWTLVYGWNLKFFLSTDRVLVKLLPDSGSFNQIVVQKVE